MPKTTAAAKLSPESQRALIAETAYFKSERRGFAPGSEVADWLEAEREVEALLAGKSTPRRAQRRGK